MAEGQNLLANISTSKANLLQGQYSRAFFFIQSIGNFSISKNRCCNGIWMIWARKAFKKWEKDLNNLQVAFDSRLRNEGKNSVSRAGFEPASLRNASRAWSSTTPYGHRTGYLASLSMWVDRTRPIQGTFSFVTFVCIMALPRQISVVNRI